jgi:hypothetical protein
MVEKMIQDDHFGPLRWVNELNGWLAAREFPPHGRISIGLPQAYLDDSEVRAHILTTLPLLERDELYFRIRAADELYASEAHHLFWPDAVPFDREGFILEMHLNDIIFDNEFSENALTLGYEYGEGMENAIIVSLTWDGDYQYTVVE